LGLDGALELACLDDALRMGITQRLRHVSGTSPARLRHVSGTSLRSKNKHHAASRVSRESAPKPRTRLAERRSSIPVRLAGALDCPQLTQGHAPGHPWWSQAGCPSAPCKRRPTTLGRASAPSATQHLECRRCSATGAFSDRAVPGHRSDTLMKLSLIAYYEPSPLQ
jgi:hypothetical protein